MILSGFNPVAIIYQAWYNKMPHFVQAKTLARVTSGPGLTVLVLWYSIIMLCLYCSSFVLFGISGHLYKQHPGVFGSGS